LADNPGLRNCGLELSWTLITALSPRVRWHHVVRAIVDHKLAIVLAAVLDGERPDAGVVGQPVAEKFRCIVQTRVALLLNHFRSVGDGFLHELDDVGLGLEEVTRFDPEILRIRTKSSAAAWRRFRAKVRSSFCTFRRRAF